MEAITILRWQSHGEEGPKGGKPCHGKRAQPAIHNGGGGRASQEEGSQRGGGEGVGRQSPPTEAKERGRDEENAYAPLAKGRKPTKLDQEEPKQPPEPAREGRAAGQGGYMPAARMSGFLKLRNSEYLTRGSEGESYPRKEL